MALVLRPSVQPWPHFRTTWTSHSNKWTRCTWALVATLRDLQTVEANLPTKWTSTGNESSKENPHELANPEYRNLAALSALFGLFKTQYWLISIVILRAEFVSVCLCVEFMFFDLKLMSNDFSHWAANHFLLAPMQNGHILALQGHTLFYKPVCSSMQTPMCWCTLLTTGGEK